MEVGGAEILVALLCRWQRREGNEITVHCLFTGGPLAEQLQQEGISVEIHALGSGVLDKFRVMRRLYRMFAKERPDVVHCHNTVPTLLGAPTARVAGARAVISTRHGLATPYSVPSGIEGIADNAGAFYRFRVAAMFCNRVVAVCDVARRNLVAGASAFFNRVVTIRNGASALPVSSTPDPSIQKEGFTLVHVARLNWKKNQAGLLRAFSIALQQVPDLFLWIIGDGAEAKNLHELARELGIESRVRFAGERKDVGDWLAKADLFVLASLTEGLPLSLVEAMAAGLPFVVTAIGGMPEVAELSGAGTVVDPNSPEALAAGIVQYARRRAELPDLGRRARECYETHFSPERMLRAYSQLYKEHVRKPRGKSRELGRQHSRDSQCPEGPRLKVLHVTLSFARGGRRTAITSLVDGLRNLGVESNLCCLNELGCEPEEVTRVVDHFDNLRRRRLLDWKGLRTLRELCRTENVDIVHTHDAASQFSAVLACTGISRIRILMTFHRSLNFESATMSNRIRNAISSVRCGAIIVPSQERRQHFLANNWVSPNKVIHIPHGVDLQRFCPERAPRRALRAELGIGPSVNLIGCIGHAGEEKGIDIAIRAFQCLSKHRLPGPVAMVIFGDGERRHVLEEMAAQGGGMPGPVHFVGFRSDIHRCMRALDVLLHTPRVEAFGLVVIEAMATGLPVVASQAGAMPELVRDGATGFLAATQEPQSIATALEKLLTNPTLLESFGKEARRVALANYGGKLCAEQHLRLYQELMSAQPVQQPPAGRVAEETRVDADLA
jgi:glycosyltransferase involved in cell wall biosynthesis